MIDEVKYCTCKEPKQFGLIPNSEKWHCLKCFLELGIMTPKEIAHKYVHGNHDALTDNQEKLYMVADIEEYAKQKDERIKELEALKDEVLKVWNEDGDNGEIQMRTPIAWHRVLRIAEKL